MLDGNLKHRSSSEPFADAVDDHLEPLEGVLDVDRRRQHDASCGQTSPPCPSMTETTDAVLNLRPAQRHNYPKALVRIYRVLKPGGRIVISSSPPRPSPSARSAKNYIMKAVRRLPPPAQILRIPRRSPSSPGPASGNWRRVQAAGFTSVQYHCTCGITAVEAQRIDTAFTPPKTPTPEDRRHREQRRAAIAAIPTCWETST